MYFFSLNTKEYLSEPFQSFMLQHGILHETSCMDTPTQNGVAKRKNRHLLEIARALLFQMHVPKHFWVDVVSTAYFLINRMMLAPRLDDLNSMRHEGTVLAPCMHQGRRSRQIVGKRVLELDEKLCNIVHEPSTHKRKASMRPSWDAHSNSRGTQGLDGARGATLEAKQDQSGRSHPYIGKKALGSKSPNWSASRSPVAQRVLRHK